MRIKLTIRDGWVIWIGWAMLVLCAFMVVVEGATALHGHRWSWLWVAYFVAMAALAVHNLRRAHRWRAARFDRWAEFQTIREEFRVALGHFGIPEDVAAEADRLIDADRTDQAARLLLKHLPEPPERQDGP